MSQTTRTEAGARRILAVFAARDKRPRYGLMLHEFDKSFRSDEWRMTDFKAAIQFAFDKGWVEIDDQFYRLSETGDAMLKTFAPSADTAA